MKYDEKYMRSKDIDWFCIINGFYVHIASAGAILPDVIKDRDKLRNMQRAVFSLPDIYSDNDLIYNEEFIQSLNNNWDNLDIKDTYLQSFKSMARKGFISIDRTNLENPDDQHYHVVCMPRHPLQINDLKIVDDIYEIQSDIAVNEINCELLLTKIF